ncbi:MAG: peptidoglycan DD-metalloendopeptidase family protein [Clostridiales bacterium]|nr:peptidoglycan DD-metalloendopeptidase family protein [Clostridiales bacterium]
MTKMKNKLIGATALLLTGIIGFSSAGVYQNVTSLAAMTSVPRIEAASKNKYDEEIKKNNAEKKKYQQKANELQQKINQNQAEYNKILDMVQALDKQMSELGDDIAEVSDNLEKLNDQIDETTKALEEAQKIRDEQYEKMKARIKYVWENGETNYVELLLNGGGLADILNRVEYVSEIAKYDEEVLENFKKAAKEVADTKEKLESEKKTQEAAKENLEADLKYTEKLAEEKNQALDKAAKQMGIDKELYMDYMYEINVLNKSAAQILALQKAEEERLRQEELKQQQSGQTGNNVPSTGNAGVTLTDKTDIGSIIWPLPGHGRITSYFGPRKQPTAGASTYHKGIDIGAPTGTKMVAALAGTVVAASRNLSMGNYVMIDHGNGVSTVYMHASKLLVKSGQYVKQGQVIALVGSTGYSTGPHLHFGLQIGGKYVNPLNYVKY